MIQPVAEDRLQEFFNQPGLQHTPLVSVIEQRQAGAGIVALRIIAGQRFVGNSDACGNLSQHVTHKSVDVGIGSGRRESLEFFSREQALEHAGLAPEIFRNRFPVVFQIPIVDNLALHKADNICCRPCCNDFGIDITAHVLKFFQNRVQPWRASGLRPSLDQIQMDDVNGLNADQLVLRVGGNVDIARMIRPKPIGLRPHPLVYLNAQPHRISALARSHGALVIH